MTQKQAKLIYGVGTVVTLGSNWKGAQGLPGVLVVTRILERVTQVWIDPKTSYSLYLAVIFLKSLLIPKVSSFSHIPTLSIPYHWFIEVTRKSYVLDLADCLFMVGLTCFSISFLQTRR